MLDTEDARRARYREIIQSLTLMDDIFMTAVALTTVRISSM